jgi:KDO2-lipid IV(A) lauroyltransferase
MGLLRLAITRVPPAIGNPAADRLGDIVYTFARKSRRNAIDNMRHVLGPDVDRKRHKQAVRGIFHNVMRNYYDLCRVPEMRDQRLDDLVEFDARGWERVVDLQRSRRGVILVTAHFGSFDVMTNFITLKGLPLTALIAQVKPAWLSDFITLLRGARGMNMVMVDEEEGSGLNLSALKQVITLLRAGGMIGVVADRNMEPYGVEIDFFGHRTLVAAGVAKLALRTRSVVVPAFCLRLPGNRYSLKFEEPFEPEGSASNEADVKAILSRIFGYFEQHIGRNPEQWVLLQPVWRR